MSGELSRMNFEVASRATALNARALLQILDSFVENPHDAVDIATQLSQAADSGQLDAQIAGQIFPAIQQAMAQKQGQPPPQR